MIPFSLDKLAPFHDHLNPRVWDGYKLRTEVRLKLLQTAIAFYRFLDLPLRVEDIILTGSNAAFNYTPLSDLDVHLIVAYTKTTCPTLAANFFTTKKTLWNQTYAISVRGQPLELYVEDADEPVKANGVYSILHGQWLKQPKPEVPAIDDIAIVRKVEAYIDEIEGLLTGKPTVPVIDDIMKRLKTLRQNGLLHGGEFSIDNLAFKVLRSLGYLDKLYNARIEARDRALSLA